MKVLVVGAGKSPNVGDQLIEKVLGWTLQNKLDIDTVSYFDLEQGKYNIDYKQPEVDVDDIKENVEQQKKYYLPRFIKTFLSIKWSDEELINSVKNNDLIIIGGGHLLIDNYSCFLLNIIRVARMAQKHNKKVVLWSVGVGSKHTYIWKVIARMFIKNIPVFTRDSKSLIRAKKLGLNTQNYILDPAFFVNDMVAPKVNKETLGLFIMDPYEMVRHSENLYKREDIAAWWLKLINILSDQYDKITIYNNGSLQDVKFIHKYLVPKIDDEKVLVHPRVLSADELIDSVNKNNLILAQRLHAVIPALALNKKVYALEWDEKLTNILADLNLQEFLLSYQMEPSQIANKLISSKPHINILDEQKLNYLQNLKSAIIENDK
ncbi:polysaccharide pyruvyl transferase family protein [Pseudoalteromonas carrageenovora]|uniref:polysaccharide pyruvyl transferase family protein n=1 Tax=Pseudoalteromonas carrageenovora TaxID=227 RepID=UPI0026E356DA|nr:polysaccharide pyruvyl transferase family protein [Pseudoalteromonas carrageenovora]MDO6835823.1 polysaccharide pyruvyl transferase family protein [Pseudoalteromonas carrageenovora]